MLYCRTLFPALTARFRPIALLFLILFFSPFFPAPASAVTASSVALVSAVNTAGETCSAELLMMMKAKLQHHFRYPYYEILPDTDTRRFWETAAGKSLTPKKLPRIPWPEVLPQMAKISGADLVIVPEITRLQHIIRQPPLWRDGDTWEKTAVELRCHVYTADGGYRFYKVFAYGDEPVSSYSSLEYRFREALDKLLPQLPPTIPNNQPVL